MAALRDIERKTSWSEDDERELFAALKRARSDYARAVALARRADAIAADHPHAAIRLRQTLLSDYTIPDSLARSETEKIATAEIAMGDVAQGVTRYRALAESALAADPKSGDALLRYFVTAARHDSREDFPIVEAMAERVEHVPPPGKPHLFGTAMSSWSLFAGLAWLADARGDDERRSALLERAREWHVNPVWKAPDPWRLWLMKTARFGGRRVSRGLARQDFALAELEPWARETWSASTPRIHRDDGDHLERLILEWPAYAVDLSLSVDPVQREVVIERMPGNRLKAFETRDARVLEWRDAGDFDAIDAINIGIDLLHRLGNDPRVVIDID